MKNKIRYVRKDTFFGRFSSWHCRETSAFLDSLGNYKSGIGRKTIKGAIQFKINSRTTIGNGLCIIYGLPLDTDGKAMQNAADDWNKDNSKKAPVAVSVISRDSVGRPTKVGFVLTLNEWALDPRDVETETEKEVANA